MFGQGVYLSPNIGKALGYTDSNNALVFICAAKMGRVRVFTDSDRSLTRMTAEDAGFDTAHGKSGFTSAWGGSLHYSEYSLFDPTRIQLLYLAEYKKIGV